MKKIVVSVVIPLYNSEKYIIKNIDNLLNQTFSNLEIIVVNDGSTDNSYNIVKNKYKEEIENDKLILIDQYNFGAPSARNKGMDFAKGEFITFIDADDYYDFNAIEKMYNKIIDDRSDIVISNSRVIDSNNKLIMEHYFYRHEDIYDLGHPEYYNCSPCPMGKLYKMDIIKKYNIRWDNLRMAQDVNFYMKYITFANSISFINDDICSYRILRDSISHKVNLNRLDLVRSINLVENFLKKHNKYDDKIKYLTIFKINHFSMQLSNSVKDYDGFIYRKFVTKYFFDELRKINLKEYNYNLITKKIIFKIKLKVYFKYYFPRISRIIFKLKNNASF